ncbi:MAG: diaminopropionate ammonia-lyase [Solobacterium sp.]|nr:diaminopropionate ammonia-lyase [Solobacterium sp.]
MNIVYNRHKGETKPENMSLFTAEKAAAIRSYHQSIDAYEPTVLADLADTGKVLGVNSIYVKDESSRFGLNAFKGLGGSYCLGRLLAEYYHLGEQFTFADLKAAGSDQMTFVTATDGNHGRGVAWAARMLGQKAVVYMPKGSSPERLENIRKQGAEAEITALNYDDTVRFAKAQAEKYGWILVQDTAWEGYEEIPLMIMQGYLTMALEAVSQLGDRKPTHIFLQAGVGAMSGAVAAYLRNVYGDDPKIIIVEPDQADCSYRTALADDGSLHAVTGDLATIMAGLACGEPCTVGYELLQYCADAFVSMPDTCAALGMRMLGNPARHDDRVISGESGAAGFGALAAIQMQEPEIKAELGIDETSAVLCFSTEGATDIANYRRVVWEGKYSE